MFVSVLANSKSLNSAVRKNTFGLSKVLFGILILMFSGAWFNLIHAQERPNKDSKLELGQHGLKQHKLKKEETSINLSTVLEKVRRNDLALLRQGIDADAFLEDANASTYLPDPVFFAAAQNLPTDTFEFDQEPMTQIRLGVKQMLPKGDSLAIQQEIANLQATQQSSKQGSRWKSLKRNTELAWLEAWHWQENLILIAEDRVFLKQIHEFIQSLYQSGSKDQSDLLGAQLELIKLDERQIEASQKQQRYRSQLNALANEDLGNARLNPELTQFTPFDHLDKQNLLGAFQRHPDILTLEDSLNLSQQKVALAEQEFEPTWGLEMSLGLRDGNNTDGSDRSNFLSAGVNVQLPLFTQGKQRSKVSAAKLRYASMKNKRDEALQKMRFDYANVAAQYRDTVKHRQLYESKLLPILKKQKQSALQSYQVDKADFRLVSELSLKEQNAKIKHLRLRVDEQQLLARIHYWVSNQAASTSTLTFTLRPEANTK